MYILRLSLYKLKLGFYFLKLLRKNFPVTSKRFPSYPGTLFQHTGKVFLSSESLT